VLYLLLTYTFVRLQSRVLRLAVTPEARLGEVVRYFPSFDLAAPPMGPCGGYSRTYLAVAEAMGIPPRGDIIWYTSVGGRSMRIPLAPVCACTRMYVYLYISAYVWL
jgi:hypothetical protein